MKLLRRLRHESLKCSRSSLHSLIALRFALSLVLSLSLLLCPIKVNYPNRRSRKSFKASFLALSMLSSRFNTSIFVHLLLRSGPLLPYIAKDAQRDRKSTRLNSSHLGISYAVFCLKKKKYARTTLYTGVIMWYHETLRSLL